MTKQKRAANGGNAIMKLRDNSCDDPNAAGLLPRRPLYRLDVAAPLVDERLTLLAPRGVLGVAEARRPACAGVVAEGAALRNALSAELDGVNVVVLVTAAAILCALRAAGAVTTRGVVAPAAAPIALWVDDNSARSVESEL